MSDPIFSIPSPSSDVAASSDQTTQAALFYGEDIWFDVASADPISGEADYVVTAAGDVALATGIEALRQSLLRRLLTNPGEWQTNPGFGVGAPQFVKKPNTPAVRAELEGRIRAQFARDDRVEAITQITIEDLTDGPGLHITVFVVVAGRLRQDAPVPVEIEVK